MKRLGITILSLAVLCLLVNVVLANTATWEVATVHGTSQFSISPDASLLHYDPQPRNTEGWYWYDNNGSAPGTLATSGYGPNGWRDGSRTFATTNVAVGQTLNSLKLAFEYNNSAYTTINFFMTDGAGKYGIFAPTSKGLESVGQTEDVGGGWTRMTIDLTREDIADSAVVAVYEHNGFVNEYGQPFTTMTWGDIKSYQIAGMYDYQRSPALGWGSWGIMFSEVNQAGSSDIVNGYGLALIWGDTVGGNTYATQSREIRNVVVSFGGTDYTGSFADATVPEPGTLALLAAAGFGMFCYAWRRRKMA